jgi:Domain of unknown function (DUF4136)
MRVKWILFVLVMLLSRSTGWAADVKVDWDKSASFTNYKTYAWTTGTPAKNPLWDQRIRDGVDAQLAAKGFQKVDVNSNPDITVLYHAAVGNEVQLNTMDSGDGVGAGAAA